MVLDTMATTKKKDPPLTNNWSGSPKGGSEQGHRTAHRLLHRSIHRYGARMFIRSRSSETRKVAGLVYSAWLVGDSGA